MGVRDRDRRPLRPTIERMEERQLLSGLMASMAAQKLHPTAVPPSFVGGIHAESGGGAGGAGGEGTGGGGGTGNRSPYTYPPTGNGFADNSSSPLLGKGTPTPGELAREAYRASFGGRYYSGPGRFSDQGTTYFYRGLGTSTTFLHGDFTMAVVTPTDPTVPFQGSAILSDKNTNSSGVQGLILSGLRSDVDAQGRPTRLRFVADPNIYAGAFYVEAAEGTVDIKYGANDKIKVTFHGRVYTNGLTNPLTNQDLYARQGRPLRFHNTGTAKR